MENENQVIENKTGEDVNVAQEPVANNAEVDSTNSENIENVESTGNSNDVEAANGTESADEQNISIEQSDVKQIKTDKKAAKANAKKQKKNGKLFWKRFASIAVIVVLVAIITAVSLCSVLTKNYDFGFNAPTFIRIHTSNSSSPNNNRAFFAGQEEYKKLLDLYKKSMQPKIMAALFQGKLGEGVTVKEGYKSLSLSGAYLEFNYDTVQKLYLNGTEYEASIVSDESYYTIVIEVTDSTSLSEVNAYFKYKTSGSGNYSYVRFVSFAAQADLYNYIENM